MSFWLMKSEPDTFSLDDLERLGTTPWDGVRNYQARNFLRSMKPGDRAFFYHSRVEPPGVVGVCRVCSRPRPDPSQFDPESPYHDPRSPRDNPRWWLVDVAFVRRFPHQVSLDELRGLPACKEMAVTRTGNRLSVTPVSEREWRSIYTRATRP